MHLPHALAFFVSSLWRPAALRVLVAAERRRAEVGGARRGGHRAGVGGARRGRRWAGVGDARRGGRRRPATV